MKNSAMIISDNNKIDSERQNCAPKMQKIPTLNEIAMIFDESGVDYTPLPDEELLYVTAFVFNFWIRVHSRSGGVFLTTHWDLCSESDELEVLRTVNQLNTRFPLVQFAWDEEVSRLHGHAWLSARGGLSRAVLIRTAIHFADIFKEALDVAKCAGLINEHDEPEAVH